MVKRNFALRNECLEKANNECANCGQTASQAHHVVPLILGGFDKLSNLVALCEECHEKVHGTKLRNHSELTKEGLNRARERGVKLGGWRGHRFGELGAHLIALNDAKKEKVKEEAKILAPTLLSLRSQGMSLRSIANHLNEEGILNSQDKKFNAVKISRLLKEIEKFTPSGPG
jgi:hypothetical protein